MVTSVPPAKLPSVGYTLRISEVKREAPECKSLVYDDGLMTNNSGGNTLYMHVLLHESIKAFSCFILSGGSTGGGGLRGFKPPPLGLPSKNLMCIEKRHHNMSRPTLCSYSTLSQAQPQTIGFKPPPPLGCQVNM